MLAQRKFFKKPICLKQVNVCRKARNIFKRLWVVCKWKVPVLSWRKHEPWAADKNWPLSEIQENRRSWTKRVRIIQTIVRNFIKRPYFDHAGAVICKYYNDYDSHRLCLGIVKNWKMWEWDQIAPWKWVLQSWQQPIFAIARPCLSRDWKVFFSTLLDIYKYK